MQYHREGDDDAHDDSGGDYNFNITMENGADAGDPAQGASFISNDATLLAGDNLVEQPRKVRKDKSHGTSFIAVCIDSFVIIRLESCET